MVDGAILLKAGFNHEFDNLRMERLTASYTIYFYRKVMAVSHI